MRDEELRQIFRSFGEPVAGGAEPPDPRRIRARGRRRRRRNLLGGATLALALVAAGAVGVRAGLPPRAVPAAGQAGPAATVAGTATTATGAATTGPPRSTGARGPGPATLPLGKVPSLNAVLVTGPGSAVAVGKGTILLTGGGQQGWVRVWRGGADLRDLNFSTASTGWALSEEAVLATADGGHSWRELREPSQGTLRRVHFASRDQGWGVAGGSDQADAGPMLPAGPTRLVHSADGGGTWSALAAPAPPQSVCFTSPGDGWLASGTRVWRSTDGGRSWGRQPSMVLPVPGGGPPYQAELQCARSGAAWVRFSGGDAALGHVPYALYSTRDGGASWRGVLAEGGTLASTLRLPAGPGSYPGPFSVIDPATAFVLSPTPPAGSVGGVLATSGGKLAGVPEIPGATLMEPASVSFASASDGWVVGRDAAGRAVILATGDGGRHWRQQLRS